MNVLISGASGMVGTALGAILKGEGHTVVQLVRGNPKAGDVAWDPLGGKLDSAALAGVDAVVHLAGENIGERWTDAKKKAIRESRTLGTTTLCEALAKMSVKPKVLVSASAIGFYGNRGDDILNESSAPGTGFLPDVCKEWEASTKAAQDASIRTVLIRIGIILSKKGGALAKMLFPFKMCVGGVIGSGKQYMSWIELQDMVSAIVFALKTEALRGPVNLVAPRAVTNHEFTKTLGKVLSRPTIFPMPAFAAHAAFGEMANDLLVGGCRVVPERLTEAGFGFKHPELEGALRAAIDAK